MNAAVDGGAVARSRARAIAAALLFGATAPLAKRLAGSMDAFVLAGLLYAGSGVALLVYRRARRSREAPLARESRPWLAGAVLAGGVIAPVALVAGLARASASSVSLLLNLEAAFTALLAWSVFREPYDRRVFAGMIALVAGGALVAWDGSQVESSGLLGAGLVAVACAAWAIDNNLTQRISAADPVQIASIKGLVAGPVNLAAGLWLSGKFAASGDVAVALAIGIAGIGASLVFYVRALRDLGTARTGAYFSIAPFSGAIVAYVFLHEPLRGATLAGGVLMALGVWLHLTERHGHAHVHEPLEHVHLHDHDEHHRHVHGPGDPAGEPHSHAHRHEALEHDHPHMPDLHHRHPH